MKVSFANSNLELDCRALVAILHTGREWSEHQRLKVTTRTLDRLRSRGLIVQSFAQDKKRFRRRIRLTALGRNMARLLASMLEEA